MKCIYIHILCVYLYSKLINRVKRLQKILFCCQKSSSDVEKGDVNILENQREVAKGKWKVGRKNCLNRSAPQMMQITQILGGVTHLGL